MTLAMMPILRMVSIQRAAEPRPRHRALHDSVGTRDPGPGTRDLGPGTGTWDRGPWGGMGVSWTRYGGAVRSGPLNDHFQRPTK